MENLEQLNETQNDLTISRQMTSYLLTTAKWGKFLAIVGFVIVSLIAVASIGMIVGFEFLKEFGTVAVPFSFLGILYLILASLYFIPTYYLYQFSEQIRQGLQNHDAVVAESAFKNLKSLFKFMGIMTLIFIVLYAIILLVALPMAMFFGPK